jgi:hypothetical protein
MSGVEDGGKSANRNAAETSCPICGKRFDSIAEVQRHLTVEHMQKGEIPNKESHEDAPSSKGS